jgi:putative peptide zinc metalloprotease protein
MGFAWLTPANRPEDTDSPEVSLWEILQARSDPAAQKPRQHACIDVSELSDRDGPYFVIKNTEEKTYYRLSPAEFKLWQRLDGQTSVQDLVVDYFMETGEFAHATVARMIDQLHWHSMLTVRPRPFWRQLRAAVVSRSLAHRLSQPARALLTRRIQIGGLDALIDRVYRWGGRLAFTRPAQVLFLLISLSGLWAFSQVLRAGSHAFIGPNIIVGLASLWAAALLPIFIHELGHALTVKHFGREVPRGGLMLYMGLPAAFVDTTDIWMEPRRARLAVTWNGPYTGLIIGGAAAIFMVFVPDAEINGFLFKMAGYAYVTVFLNVNPLLKFDGYYLLADLLDISALRERSLGFLRRQLPGKITSRQSLNRNEWVYTIYGLLSLSWMGYAIYLAAFFWRSRISSAVQAIFGEGYSLFTRLFSFLILAGLFSMIALIGLGIVRLFGRLGARFVRSGGLTRHHRLGWILAFVAVVLAFGAAYAFPTRPQIGQAIAWLSPLAAAAAWLLSVRILWPTARGIALGLLAVALLLSPISVFTSAVSWPMLSSGLAILAGLILTGGIKRRLLGPPLIGLLVAALVVAIAVNVPTLVLDPFQSLLLGLVAGLGAWLVVQMRGGARPPALLLFYGGSTALLLSSAMSTPSLLLEFLGIHLMAGGAVHWTIARLPDLTRVKVPGVSSSPAAIGLALTTLIRRVIAQAFFEGGWAGVANLGRDFNQQMKGVGLRVKIQGNTFSDATLSDRSVLDLTESYGQVLDCLHQLISRHFGSEMARLTFGYGIDLLPWENREVIDELLLSRRPWGLSIGEQLKADRDQQRQLLKRVPLFVSLSEEALDALARRLSPIRFAIGEDIILQGERGDRFYILAGGSADVLRSASDGGMEKIDQKGPGQYFGETALVADQPRNATIRAATPTLVYALDRRDFESLVKAEVSLVENLNSGVAHSWLLRAMPLFDELEGFELEWMALQLESERLEPGRILFEEGEDGRDFYIVESGQVSVSRAVEGGQAELSRRGPGEYFGEIALLQHRPRTARVTAVEPTVVLKLNAGDFEDLVGGYGEFAKAVNQSGSRRLAFVERVSAAGKTSQT